MLVDPVFRKADGRTLEALSVVFGGSLDATRLDEGLYEITHYSFDMLLSKGGGNLHDEDDWESWYNGLPDDHNAYGVCDSPEQFMEVLGNKLKEDEANEYVVSFTAVRKIDQAADGGWRWHKWGPYIGNQNPQYEYLYDEDDIDEVYTYHIYHKKN